MTHKENDTTMKELQKVTYDKEFFLNVFCESWMSQRCLSYDVKDFF